MKTILAIVRKVFVSVEAATLIEYGFVLLLVALVCISLVAYIGSALVLPMYQLPGL